MATFKTIHVLIGGFAQRPYGLGNSIPVIADDLRKRFSSPDVLICEFPWFTGGIAEYIARRCEPKQTRVQIAGYSWGGQTAADVACELVGYVSGVDLQLTLSDAVARRSRFPGAGWASAFRPLSKIVVPDEARVVSFIQRVDRWPWPRGHKVVTVSGREIPQVELGLTHTRMDGAEDFSREVVAVAEGIQAK